MINIYSTIVGTKEDNWKEVVLINLKSKGCIIDIKKEEFIENEMIFFKIFIYIEKDQLIQSLNEIKKSDIIVDYEKTI